VKDLITNAFKAAKVHLRLLEFEVFSKEVYPSLNLFNYQDKFPRLLLQNLRTVSKQFLKLLIVLVVLEVLFDFSDYSCQHLLSLQDRHAALLKVFSACEDNSLVKINLLD
jgi:hypothetical protein